jgi:DNA-binding CsgD family transcriptional regulator
MPTASDGFSQHVQNCIRDTAKAFLIRVGDDPALYDCWRFSMANICPIDAFYVGFFRGERKIVFPYTYEGRSTSSPEMHTYREDGVAAWVRATGRPYLYRHDGGRRLNRGYTFGDSEKLSSDAVNIPIHECREGTRVVAGVASMQTYSENAYTDEHVRAFQVTADLFVTARTLTDPTGGLHDLLRTAGIRPVRPGSVDDLIDGILSLLNELRPRIEALTDPAPMTYDRRLELAHRLHRGLLRVQIHAAEALGTPPDVQAALDTLPPRARELARLVADKKTDADIMREMHISLGTVKTYLANIREVLDVRSREGIIAKLRPFG